MGQHGRRFPDPYLKDVPPAQAMARRSSGAAQALRQPDPETIIEPGRGMVGNAGVIKSEVVLISKKADNDNVRWVYLDIGKFGGLAETMDEAIRYPDRTPP
jgi:ornithine decarboxylase